MRQYLHGTRGEVSATPNKVADQGRSAVLYIGTAPVHTVPGGAANLHKPVAVSSFQEAAQKFGYSEDWASYTLCEAMYAHLMLGGVGPVILINVLDVEAVTTASGGSVSLTPANGRVVIPLAGDIILDSVEVTGKALGTDYTLSYDHLTQRLTLRETALGSLGTAALALTYETVDPAGVTEADVIGLSDGEGRNTGIAAVKNVYQDTGYIPTLMLCPGFSEQPQVHAAMARHTRDINGHWDMHFYADLPILNGSEPMALGDVATWKKANGYTHDNEKVFFPLALGTDGRRYHLSVLCAANFQALTRDADGIPYQSASNTPCPILQNLYLGEERKDLRLDDSVINDKLTQYGIASAAFIGGQWVLWGAHAAAYDPEEADDTNLSETSLLMLYYISNDFQRRRATEIDTPMTMGRIRQIVAEEQARLDALVSTGALLFGECALNASPEAFSDMVQGDFSFKFNLTTTPLCKSMTALVNWTDDGFATYFASGEGA